MEQQRHQGEAKKADATKIMDQLIKLPIDLNDQNYFANKLKIFKVAKSPAEEQKMKKYLAVCK